MLNGKNNKKVDFMSSAQEHTYLFGPGVNFVTHAAGDLPGLCGGGVVDQVLELKVWSASAS